MDTRTEQFQAFLSSSLWREYIRPEYERWLAADLEELIASEIHEGERRGSIAIMQRVFRWLFKEAKAEGKAERRGRVQRLRRLLSWPQSEVEASVAEQEREAQFQKDFERFEHLASRGFKAPIRPPES